MFLHVAQLSEAGGRAVKHFLGRRQPMAGEYRREDHEQREGGRERGDVPQDPVHAGQLVREGTRTKVVQCAEGRRQD